MQYGFVTTEHDWNLTFSLTILLSSLGLLVAFPAILHEIPMVTNLCARSKNNPRMFSLIIVT